MDRGLSRGPSSVLKGGARAALPFFACCLALAPAAGARADDAVNAPVNAVASTLATNAGSLDLGARLLYSQPSALNGAAAAEGLPRTGGLWLLWGGGATLNPAPLRVQVSAWKGSLGASSPDGSSAWNLGLAALTMEQEYLAADFLLTAGAGLEGGELDGALNRAAGGYSGVSAALFGYNLQVGARWPAQTPLGLFLRAGWEILYGPGDWHGSGDLGGQLFELGGPTATLQLELNL